MARTAQMAGHAPQSNHEFAGISMEMAQALAAQGIEPPSADAMVRRRVPDQILELSPEDLEDTVRVICLSENKPWTHERPLDMGEQTVIPRKLAVLMQMRRQIAIIAE